MRHIRQCCGIRPKEKLSFGDEVTPLLQNDDSEEDGQKGISKPKKKEKVHYPEMFKKVKCRIELGEKFNESTGQLTNKIPKISSSGDYSKIIVKVSISHKLYDTPILRVKKNELVDIFKNKKKKVVIYRSKLEKEIFKNSENHFVFVRKVRPIDEMEMCFKKFTHGSHTFTVECPLTGYVFCEETIYLHRVTRMEFGKEINGQYNFMGKPLLSRKTLNFPEDSHNIFMECSLDEPLTEHTKIEVLWQTFHIEEKNVEMRKNFVFQKEEEELNQIRKVFNFCVFRPFKYWIKVWPKGIYTCSSYIDEILVAKRHFLIGLKFNITIDDFENNGKVGEISGKLKTNFKFNEEDPISIELRSEELFSESLSKIKNFQIVVNKKLVNGFYDELEFKVQKKIEEVEFLQPGGYIIQVKVADDIVQTHKFEIKEEEQENTVVSTKKSKSYFEEADYIIADKFSLNYWTNSGKFLKKISMEDHFEYQNINLMVGFEKNFLVTASSTKLFKWEMKEKKFDFQSDINCLRSGGKHSDNIIQLSLLSSKDKSTESQRILTSSKDCTIGIWSAQTVLDSYRGNDPKNIGFIITSSPVFGLCEILTENDKLFFCSGEKNGIVKLWDFSKESVSKISKKVVFNEEKAVRAFSTKIENGKSTQLAFAGDSQKIRIVDISTMKINSTHTTGNTTLELKYSNDKEDLIVRSSGRLTVDPCVDFFDLKEKKSVLSIPVEDTINVLQIKDNNIYICSGDSMFVYDYRNPKESVYTITADHMKDITSVFLIEKN